MLEFVLAALSLLTVVLGIIIYGMRLHVRQYASFTDIRKKLNIAIYREQLEEIDAELPNAAKQSSPPAIQRLDPLTSIRDDLAKRLLKENRSDAEPLLASHPIRASRSTPLIITILLPITALLGYTLLGEPAALQAKKRSAIHSEQMQQISIRDAIAQIEAKLTEAPENLEGWKKLAEAYSALEEISKTQAVYTRALRYHPHSPDLLIGQAEIIAKLNENQLTGEPTQLIERALSIAPNHRRGLWLGGLVSLLDEDHKMAQARWQRLRKTYELTAEEEKLLQHLETMVKPQTTP